MADPDYESMTDDQLLATAHTAGVDASPPKAPAGATGSPTTAASLGKIGMNVAGAGVTAAAAAAALKYPEVRSMLEEVLAKATNTGAETPIWQKAGLRTAEDAPLARNLAGPSGMEALRLHTATVANQVAAGEAGIPGAQGFRLSQDTLSDARREPNAVYDRLANDIPTGQLNPTAQQAIQQGGDPGVGRMSAGTPEAQAAIGTLKAQLLDPAKMFTGQNFINEMRGLRQEGFSNIASEDVSQQQIGRAQLQFARAIEGHVADSIPDDASVTPEQFQDARKTLAKNSSIQSALRGNDVDLQVLARIHRADPQLLDGGTRMLAQFADEHPEVASLPTQGTRYNPPSATRDLQDISLKNPASWIRPALGNLARRSLVGDPDEASAMASQMFPPGATDRFLAPNRPTTPPPKFGGYLPAPSMVNAGNGATTANSLRDLGLTPDVQAAGSQHPAAARLQALRQQLAVQPPERPAEPVDFQGPQKWGDFSIAPETPAPQAPTGGVPYENVLEQGGTQRAPVGLPGVAYRPPSISPNQNKMRTPEGAPAAAPMGLPQPSDAQNNFRNQQAAARLRKVAGDLTVEGPGGNTGSPLDRLRAALERRDRGYADGGVVRNSSSPGSPGVSGAVRDALGALKDYLVDNPKRELQAQREGYENQVINAQGAESSAPTNDASNNYASGGSTSGQTLQQQIEAAFNDPYSADWPALQQSMSQSGRTVSAPANAAASLPEQQSIEDATRSLSDLLSTHEQAPTTQMAEGGTVRQALMEFMERVANEQAAKDTEIAARTPPRPRPPLVQGGEAVPTVAAAAPQGPSLPPSPPENPLQPGFLSVRQAMADGGSVDDDTKSSIRRLAEAARGLNPSSGPQAGEDRARIATNLASLVYGLDAQGKPALGGRAWTQSQGGTPAGVLDAISAVPHGLAQAGATLSGLPHSLLQAAAAANKASPIQVVDPKTLDAVDSYLPGKGAQDFWNSIDPPASKAAAQRLSQLKARLQQTAGVAPAKSGEDVAMDTISDPGLIAPMGIAKLAGEAPAVKRLLNWGAGSTGDPTPAAQGN